VLNPPERSAVETLIENGFKPTRTIVLAFGFDEETSGLQVGYYPPPFYISHIQIGRVATGESNAGKVGRGWCSNGRR
jgi:hypothetical protein